MPRKSAKRTIALHPDTTRWLLIQVGPPDPSVRALLTADAPETTMVSLCGDGVDASGMVGLLTQAIPVAHAQSLAVAESRGAATRAGRSRIHVAAARAARSA